MRAPGRIWLGFCAASSSHPENTPPDATLYYDIESIVVELKTKAEAAK